jgi:predicted nucleic acid-binding protein
MISTPTVFVDTNVLVYARDARDEGKREAAKQWLTALWRAEAGRLSFQVLSEYYHAVTERLRPPLPVEIAQADVRHLLEWRPRVVDATVIEDAWAIRARYSCSWWDGLIVAAARLTNCNYLLTEDLQEGCRYGDLLVVNPFAARPEDLLG